MKVLFLITVVCLYAGNSFSRGRDAIDRSLSRRERLEFSKPKDTTVKWVGEIKCDSDSHTTDHEHQLVFIRKNDQKKFDVVDSPKFTNFHCKNEKNYLVEIEGQKTSQFLFWGGNLQVKNFKILESNSKNIIPHTKPKEPQERVYRELRNRKDRY